jgi:phosphoglycolate phosphatase-like HAD superfamily hydrolase
VDARARVKAVAVDLDALGDTRKLLADWRADAAHRFRVDSATLEEEVPNWEKLLERFAEERVPVYLRPDAEASAVLRRLRANGIRIGVFTDAPAALARVALAQVGAARRVTAVETGAGALERLLLRFGDETRVVRTRDELLGLR